MPGAEPHPRRTVEFTELVLRDFRCFGGEQRIVFEPPAADGRSGVTALVGWGARGKTAVVDALELALWGIRRQMRSPRRTWFSLRLGRDALREPMWLINCDALQGAHPEAAAALTLRVTECDGRRWTLAARRTWTWVDGVVRESLEAEVREAGRTERLVAGPAQWRIDEVLPPGRPPLVFVDYELEETIGRLTSIRHDVREEAEVLLARLVGEWPEELWREVADPVIAAADTMLRDVRGDAEVWLLPESAGRLWGGGAYPIAPGIWATDEHIDAMQLTAVGLALLLGPHLAGAVRAPLVLDAPANRFRPDMATGWLEALVTAVVPQVIVASHAELLEFPALTLQDRMRWIELYAEHGSGPSVVAVHGRVYPGVLG